MTKVLVVDDEEKIRRIYKAFLTFEDYETLEAKDAETALQLLRDNLRDIRLILLDINMPTVGGATLYEVIREVYGDNFKVIVSSVYPLEEQKRLIVKADDYYDKSQGTDILLEKIKHVLRQPVKNHG